MTYNSLLRSLNRVINNFIPSYQQKNLDKKIFRRKIVFFHILNIFFGVAFRLFQRQVGENLP